MRMKLPIEAVRTILTLVGVGCTVAGQHIDDRILDKKIKKQVINTIAHLGKKKN